MSAGQYTLECARSDTLSQNRRKKCQIFGKFLAIELLDCEKIIQEVTTLGIVGVPCQNLGLSGVPDGWGILNHGTTLPTRGWSLKR